MVTARKKRTVGAYSLSSATEVGLLTSDDLLFHELIETQAFRRLGSIRFLGGIDYLMVRTPNGANGNIRYTRYQHSLGVARLALLYAERRSVSNRDRQILYAAALLHDLGHAPLSHSLEPVFLEHFGLEHHRATHDIIVGRTKFGKEVLQVLQRHKVDVDRVLALVSGRSSEFDGFFNGPINFDTIEAILRSRSYAKWATSAPPPETVAEAAIDRATPMHQLCVDNFWECKDLVYSVLINSARGILADYVCQQQMLSALHKFSADDYFQTEEHIFRKLPSLKSTLRKKSFENDILSSLSQPIKYSARKFFVDAKHDFFSRIDRERYRQTKEKKILHPIGSTTSPSASLNQDIFDDDTLRAQQDLF